MRRVGICSVALMICICFVLPSYAFFNSDVKKAKEFIKADMYPQAIELLTKRINDKPADAEAHYLLGVCQLKTNNVSEADESFARAAKLDGDYKSKIAGVYKDLCESDLKMIRLEAAEAHYAKMVAYAPPMKDPEFLKQIGYRYLKKAAETNGSTRESYRRRAIDLVGDQITSEVFPGQKTVTVFEKTYSDKDADEYGRIRAVDWSKIDAHVDDQVTVGGKNPNAGPDMKILSSQKWVPIDRGKGHKHNLEINPKKGYLYIWMEKGKNIQAVVKVTRQVTPEPNVALLNTLIKLGR